MGTFSRHSVITRARSSKSESFARSSLMSLRISFLLTVEAVRNSPHDITSFCICFGGRSKFREMNTLLPREAWRCSSQSWSIDRRRSFSSFETVCLPFPGSKLVEFVAVEATETGRDGGDEFGDVGRASG